MVDFSMLDVVVSIGEVSLEFYSVNGFEDSMW